MSTSRAQPGGVNDTVRKICDGSSTQIAGGDAIVFLDGTYFTSSFNLPLPADAIQPGRAGNAIALLGKNCGGPLYIKLLADNARRAVILNDVRTNDTSGGFDIRNSSYIWIEGFEIIGINDPLVPWESGVKFSNGSHHLVARNNLVENVGGGAMGAGGATHVRIENNDIRNNANTHPYCDSGVSLYRMDNPSGYADDANGYANYVVGNRVFGTRSKEGCDADTNPANGVRSSDGNCVIIDLNNQTSYANKTLIANNLCVDNGGGGVHIFNSSYVDVINNTLYANGAVHRLGELSVTCSAAGTAQDVRFINNLVWATTTAPAVASNFNSGCVMSGIVHSHNLFVGNAPLVSDFLGVPYLQITTDLPQLRASTAANLVGVTPLEIGITRVDIDPTAARFAIGVAASPAVDSGLASDCEAGAATPCTRNILPAEFTTDVAGKPRATGVIDIGAHEYPGVTVPVDPPAPPPAAPPAQSVTVRASATIAGGLGAQFEVYANGELLATVLADSTEMRDFVLPVGSSTPIERIDVVFVNDAVVNGEDRNLFVESVKVNAVTITPSSAGVTFDQGSGPAAYDGTNVIAGQRGLYWNGALRIVVPKL